MSNNLRWWARWGFMGAQDIGDDPYLDRLRILWTPLFSVYLHHIHKDDGNRAAHDHPWRFWSFVLTGGYTELFFPDKQDFSRVISRTHRRWSLHSISTKGAHRIVSVDKPLWTLVITGPPSNVRWGFYPDGKFVPWQEYGGRENVTAGWPSWKTEGVLREPQAEARRMPAREVLPDEWIGHYKRMGIDVDKMQIIDDMGAYPGKQARKGDDGGEART